VRSETPACRWPSGVSVGGFYYASSSRQWYGARGRAVSVAVVVCGTSTCGWCVL
jgi:hypothetical protein